MEKANQSAERWEWDQSWLLLGALLLPLSLSNSPFFLLHLRLLYFSILNLSVSVTLSPSLHCSLLHESCDRASYTSFGLTPTFILLSTASPIPLLNPTLGFPLHHQTLSPPPHTHTHRYPRVPFSLATPLYRVHSSSSDYYSVCSH